MVHTRSRLGAADGWAGASGWRRLNIQECTPSMCRLTRRLTRGGSFSRGGSFVAALANTAPPSDPAAMDRASRSSSWEDGESSRAERWAWLRARVRHLTSPGVWSPASSKRATWLPGSDQSRAPGGRMPHRKACRVTKDRQTGWRVRLASVAKASPTSASARSCSWSPPLLEALGSGNPSVWSKVESEPLSGCPPPRWADSRSVAAMSAGSAAAQILGSAS
eukprot:CAMPEP_0172638510 /NCGR_PEP_ID=MMETSP1068-20121228/214088_1 /TAXON_ID=35684 /ORGANISM="Pseudopedinella elastica, Strain CCMP716" /LENGTH=220 /DNA_ID=CAMNT_0013451415 /DNA_START=387 /DNA_END=1045 /DNA_ORIENTATION=-